MAQATLGDDWQNGWNPMCLLQFTIDLRGVERRMYGRFRWRLRVARFLFRVAARVLRCGIVISDDFAQAPAEAPVHATLDPAQVDAAKIRPPKGGTGVRLPPVPSCQCAICRAWRRQDLDMTPEGAD